MTTNKEQIFDGSAWYNPLDASFYAGHVGDTGVYMGALGEQFQGGILTDVQTIEAKVVLEELLGLARPDYLLDACCRTISTPELVLDVDTETVGSGQADVKPLQESEIMGKTFSRTHFECLLNEAHIVVEDRAAKKASHDVLRLNIEDAAREISDMRNGQIATILEAGTAYGATEEWDDMTTAPNSDHDPMVNIGDALAAIECAGYKVEYMAVDPTDWNHFLTNTYIAPLVTAGILNIGGTPTVTLPGWPSVKVIVDCALTAGKCIIGSTRGTILAEGPTEAVRYRNELKRYTGYIIRQYVQPQIVIAGAVKVLTVV